MPKGSNKRPTNMDMQTNPRALGYGKAAAALNKPKLIYPRLSDAKLCMPESAKNLNAEEIHRSINRDGIHVVTHGSTLKHCLMMLYRLMCTTEGFARSDPEAYIVLRVCFANRLFNAKGTWVTGDSIHTIKTACFNDVPYVGLEWVPKSGFSADASQPNMAKTCTFKKLTGSLDCHRRVQQILLTHELMVAGMWYLQISIKNPEPFLQLSSSFAERADPRSISSSSSSSSRMSPEKTKGQCDKRDKDLNLCYGILVTIREDAKVTRPRELNTEEVKKRIAGQNDIASKQLQMGEHGPGRNSSSPSGQPRTRDSRRRSHSRDRRDRSPDRGRRHRSRSRDYREQSPDQGHREQSPDQGHREQSPDYTCPTTPTSPPYLPSSPVYPPNSPNFDELAAEREAQERKDNERKAVADAEGVAAAKVVAAADELAAAAELAAAFDDTTAAEDIAENAAAAKKVAAEDALQKAIAVQQQATTDLAAAQHAADAIDSGDDDDDDEYLLKSTEDNYQKAIAARDEEQPQNMFLKMGLPQPGPAQPGPAHQQTNKLLKDLLAIVPLPPPNSPHHLRDSNGVGGRRRPDSSQQMRGDGNWGRIQNDGREWGENQHNGPMHGGDNWGRTQNNGREWRPTQNNGSEWNEEQPTEEQMRVWRQHKQRQYPEEEQQQQQQQRQPRQYYDAGEQPQQQYRVETPSHASPNPQPQLRHGSSYTVRQVESWKEI
jgi:hypothetical protein